MTHATAEVSTVIDASRMTVWDALTDPAAIEEYFMGAKVHTDWKVGSPITWDGDWQGKQFEDKGEIRAFEPAKRLSFSNWSPLAGGEDKPDNYHVVDIKLSSVGGGTRVTLTQSNLNGKVTDEDRAHRAEFEKNWSSMLEGLKKVAEG